MGKRLFLGCVLILLMAAAADPLICSAEGDPLASPTPRPTLRIAAPEISGVNLEIVKPEGDEGEITPSGGFLNQYSMRVSDVGLPVFLELEPTVSEKLPASEGRGLIGPEFDLGLMDQESIQHISNGYQSLPWMGILGAITSLALAFNRSSPTSWKSPMATDPRRKRGNGMKTMNQKCSAEERTWVQVGLRGVKLNVPVYETRRVRAGFKKEVHQVPVYKNVKVYSGTRLVEKKIPVTRYRTKKVWAWKKISQRVPVVRWIGSKRITVGYRDQNRWKRVPLIKRVPFRTTKTILIKEPVYQTKKIQSGLKTVTRWVPKYQEKQVLVGYQMMKQTFPIFDRDGVQAEDQKINIPIPGIQTPEEHGSDVGLSEKERRLKEELLQPRAPEKEIAELLRKGVGPAWPPQEGKELRESWIYRTILFFQSCREGIGRIARKFGAPSQSAEGPHLFSISAYQEAPQTLLSGEGVSPHSYLPPHYMNLILTRQKLEIGPKVEVTAFPNGLMNLNLTRKSWSMKIGQTTFFVTAAGEVGFSKKIKTQDSVYDETILKYSLSFGKEGISIKSKIEGVILYKERSSANLEIKEIRTLQGQNTTLRAQGILVGALVLIVIAALLYLYFNAGIPVPFPGTPML